MPRSSISIREKGKTRISPKGIENTYPPLKIYTYLSIYFGPKRMCGMYVNDLKKIKRGHLKARGGKHSRTPLIGSSDLFSLSTRAVLPRRVLRVIRKHNAFRHFFGSSLPVKITCRPNRCGEFPNSTARFGRFAAY